MTRERGSCAESKNCEILLLPTADRRLDTKVKCPTGRASFWVKFPTVRSLTRVKCPGVARGGWAVLELTGTLGYFLSIYTILWDFRPLHDVNFAIDLTQAKKFIGRFITFFTVIQTKTYIFRISTSPKSICDKTTAKKCWSLSKILFCWRGNSSLRITQISDYWQIFTVSDHYSLWLACIQPHSDKRYFFYDP